jgi:IS30 family transposase
VPGEQWCTAAQTTDLRTRWSAVAKHNLFTIATNVKVYFCDPSSPWQRGSNENTNGLLPHPQL